MCLRQRFSLNCCLPLHAIVHGHRQPTPCSIRTDRGRKHVSTCLLSIITCLHVMRDNDSRPSPRWRCWQQQSQTPPYNVCRSTIKVKGKGVSERGPTSLLGPARCVLEALLGCQSSSLQTDSQPAHTNLCLNSQRLGRPSTLRVLAAAAAGSVSPQRSRTQHSTARHAPS